VQLRGQTVYYIPALDVCDKAVVVLDEVITEVQLFNTSSSTDYTPKHDLE